MLQQTLVLLKPDAVKRGLIGEIISRFEKAGLKIVAMKMVWVDRKLARKHYEEHVKKDFYPGLEAFITSGPVVAMVIEGIDAVEVVRKIVGGTEPKTALPGTIRGDYAHISKEWANKKGKAVANLIHASDSLKNAKREIGVWFRPWEIHSYKTLHEEIVF
jgi:nucleoside-diphosphate kinase